MRYKEYLKESINDKGILKACFMAGLPGSGKSYVISKITGGIEPKIVNTDTFTEFLKIYHKDWSTIEKERIKRLTKQQLSLYLNSMLPLWVDGTSSSPPSVFRRVGILKSLGYDVSMIWVETSLETSLKRAKTREREVPEEYIKQVYNSIVKLKPYYRKEFKTFITIKNDEGEINDKTILSAYKKMQSFFNSPSENPIGISMIERMKDKGDKYLSDSEYDLQEIKSLVDGWYNT